MTEGNDDGKNLVRVRAQVMMRDDSTGGWVPMGGGGLSNVSVRKRVIQPDLHDNKQEYLIYGKRISDQTVVLSCTIKKDFEYNKVMPTFHHWRTGDHKFGLTFQTAADARAFDRGVRLAVEDLLDGLTDFPAFRYGQHTPDVEDDVFMTINLPVERDGSRSSSGSVTTSSSSRHTPTTTPLPTPDHPSHPLHPTPPDTHLHRPHLQHHHHHYHPHITSAGGGGGGSLGGVTSTTSTSPSTTATTAGCTTGQPYSSHSHANHHRITFMPRHSKPALVQNNPQEKFPDLDYESKPGCHLGGLLDSDKIEVIGGETYSYVEFVDRPVTHHEYHYPVLEGKRDSIASIKKELVGDTQAPQIPPLLPGKPRKIKNRRNRKAKCRHCHDSFSDDTNSRGSCEYAPDYVRSAIDTLTCIKCAQCMLYHCMSDAEGDFAHHPCECGGVGGAPDESCGKRWLGLTLLSLLVPCLWCYLPLRACHRCAVACGICGGRHQAS